MSRIRTDPGFGSETRLIRLVARLDPMKDHLTFLPPVGATVPYLPEEAKKVKVSGKTFMVYEHTYYQPFVSGGDTIYMVVQDPHKTGE